MRTSICCRYFLHLIEINFQTAVLLQHNECEFVLPHLVYLLFGAIRVRQSRDNCRAVPSEVPVRCQSCPAGQTTTCAEEPLRLRAKLWHSDGTVNTQNVSRINIRRCLLICFLFFSASGSFCVKGSDPPFCPKRENEIGDKRCCLEAPEWNALI